MSSSGSKSKIYRLRNLPTHVDRLAAVQLTATALDDSSITASDIQIFSLATTVEPLKKWQVKVATLSFVQTPATLQDSSPGGRDGTETSEWRFNVIGLREPLILDTHFRGLTVLNEVQASDHQYDCIAISGLGSHPFGSWAPKGDDKSFMWIRDALPQSIPWVRFLLYGYDTTLVKSNSFKTIVDLGRTLMLELEANGWATPSAKSLLFLAHSLGGVLLKQLMVMLANGNERAMFMLKIIRGAVFFGTPSVGMPLSHLLAMVDRQPNKDLVEALSDQSSFLEDLQRQFDGLSFVGRMRLFWAYETETSPTVERLSDGSYKRSGPRSVMVDRLSATSGRYLSELSSTIQIDEDHSSMVKFALGDHRILILIRKICDICLLEDKAPSRAQITHDLPLRGHANEVEDNNPSPSVPLPSGNDSSEIDYDLLIFTLRPPERDSRLEQIDESFGHTFHWAFNHRSLGLSQWLRRGSGIYWVSGKPGSGKSTFMKFLLNDTRTVDLLHNWKSDSTQIVASFFFHHRGSIMQKSFDGLLRSLLSQMLEMEPRLRPLILDPVAQQRNMEDLVMTAQKELSSDVRRFLRLYELPLTLQDDLISRLAQNPILMLDSRFAESLSDIPESLRIALKGAILRRFNILCTASEDTLRTQVRLIQNQFPGLSPFLLERTTLVIVEWCAMLDISSTIKLFLSRRNLLRLPPEEHFVDEGSWRARDRENRRLEEKLLFEEHINSFVKSQKAPSQRDIFQFGMSGRAQAEELAAYREFEGYIGDLAKSQNRRRQKQLAAQLPSWTRSQVEESIRRVFEQDVLDLNICLFFDALDEYDGRPETISEFLQDLTRNPNAKSKVKILFSSRPWPEFQVAFKGCGGFKIHEYTHQDIRDFCTGFLPEGHTAKSLISPLVDGIVQRARGVFLWVKLVMRDLANITESLTDTQKDVSSILQQCLDSLPDELDDYYSAIVQRLPLETRQETYILLECLAKSTLGLVMSEVPMLIESAYTRSSKQAEAAWLVHEYTEGYGIDAYLKTISGGLIDNPGGRPSTKIQLLHQTCREWIESSTFKHLVLGDQASQTWENGHTFLVRYYTMLWLSDRMTNNEEEILKHIAQGETTTGISQHEFLTRLPMSFYSVISTFKAIQITSELLFAVCNGLWLFLKDAINHDGSIIARSTDPLISALLLGARHRYQEIPIVMAESQYTNIPEDVEIGLYILEHGFELERDPRGISILMDIIWNSLDSKTAELYIRLFSAVVGGSLDPNTTFEMSAGSTKSVVRWPLLHQSPPSLARKLLNNGAMVNSTNSLQQTALDYVLDPNSVHQRCTYGMGWLYKMASLLVERGGVLQQCPKAHLEHFRTTMAENGYAIDAFASLQPVVLSDKTRTEDVAPRKRDVSADLQPVVSSDETPKNAMALRKRDVSADLQPVVSSDETPKNAMALRKRDRFRRFLKGG